MTDTPKFTVVDRRKLRESEESTPETAAPEAPAKPTAAPRLTLVEPIQQHAAPEPVAIADEPAESLGLESEDDFTDSQLPPVPTAEEMSFQFAAYEQAAQRIDDLVRAQNPGAPAAEKIGFEHLVQQLYLSAMMQMGAGTPEGQRPRIDILGARQTIDLLGVVLERSKGNISQMEERTLLTVLFEVRMNFLELTRMISMQAQAPMPPPPGSPTGPRR